MQCGLPQALQRRCNRVWLADRSPNRKRFFERGARSLVLAATKLRGAEPDQRARNHDTITGQAGQTDGLEVQVTGAQIVTTHLRDLRECKDSTRSTPVLSERVCNLGAFRRQGFGVVGVASENGHPEGEPRHPLDGLEISCACGKRRLEPIPPFTELTPHRPEIRHVSRELDEATVVAGLPKPCQGRTDVVAVVAQPAKAERRFRRIGECVGVIREAAVERCVRFCDPLRRA